MKIKKPVRVIAFLAVIAVLALGMAACEPEVTPGPAQLRGNPSIPAEVLIGQTVEADISKLTGGRGAFGYQWQYRESGGNWQDIGAATGKVFELDGDIPGIAEGNELRVAVTREDREGTRYSDAAAIYDSVYILSVVIEPVIPDLEEVEKGKSYQFKAVVEHDGSNPDAFQKVIWEVDSTESAISDAGLLTVSEFETMSVLTITAASFYDDEVVSIGLEFSVIASTNTSSMALPIVTFAVTGDSSFPDLVSANAESGPVPGKPGTYFMRNSKSQLESGTYEVNITLTGPVDLTSYTWMSFDVYTETSGSVAGSLLGDMTGFYPRFRAGGDYVQFARSNSNQAGSPSPNAAPNTADWHMFREALRANPTVPAQMAFSIDYTVGTNNRGPNDSILEGPFVQSVMSQVTSITIRHICGNKLNYDCALYYSNFRVHGSRPLIEQ